MTIFGAFSSGTDVITVVGMFVCYVRVVCSCGMLMILCSKYQVMT